jgi:hypothetical protein
LVWLLLVEEIIVLAVHRRAKRLHWSRSERECGRQTKMSGLKGWPIQIHSRGFIQGHGPGGVRTFLSVGIGNMELWIGTNPLHD